MRRGLTTAQLITECKNRDEAARLYWVAIANGCKDWRDINGAVLKRWSPSGLEYVKKKAWEYEAAMRR